MQSTGKKIFLLILLVILVVVAALILSNQSEKSTSNSNNEQQSPILVNKVDLSRAQNNSDKIPPGMPTDIPLEYATISDSYKAEYTEKNAVQYTVSYRTTKGVREKYNEYLDYMTQAGYDFGTAGIEEANTSLYGVRGGDDLSVKVTTSGTGTAAHTLVQLSYLDRR